MSTPGLYLNGVSSDPCWPWQLALTSAAAERIYEHPHHFAPDKVADLLRVKKWKFDIAKAGDDAFTLSQVVTAGTAYRDLSGVVEVHNTPGWVNFREVLERYRHDTAEDFSPLALASYWYYFADHDAVDYTREREVGITLLIPRLAFADDDPEAPTWNVPFENQFGVFGSVTYRYDSDPLAPVVMSSTTGLTYDGEDIGTPDPDWTIEVTIEENFA
jgi:hypothetical protein